MRWIFFGVILVFSAIAFAIYQSIQMANLIAAALFSLLLVLVWVALEIWTHAYVSKHGILSPTPKTRNSQNS
ncbi:MAG: hypothetical protein AAF558_02105 [Verrucomicrobiota bacterium]